MVSVKFDFKQIVVFKLAGETFGVSVQSIDEVVLMMKVEKVPLAPEFLEGFIRLRGESVAVVDLRRYFGHPKESDSYETKILVTRVGDRKIGFIVDSVSDVSSLAEDSTEQPIIQTAKTRFLCGVTHGVDGRTIQLLAMDQILDAESLGQLKMAIFDA